MTTETLTHEQLRAQVQDALSPHGLSIEEFVRRGRADELQEDDLRDLWLATYRLIS